MTRRARSLALLMTVAGCGACATTPTPASTTTSTSAPALAPIPFRAAQLKEGNPQGQRYRWKVSGADGGVVYKVFVFDAVDDRGATITARDEDEAGQTLQAQTATSTWDELRLHASFPAERTTVEEKEVTVPAGTYLCQWYTVRGEDGAVSHFCFVVDLPGPPVFFDQWKGAAQQMKSELVARGVGP